MSYGSAFPGFAHPKGAPRTVAKAQRTRDRTLIDDRESTKVRERSGGWCEICARTHTWLTPPVRADHVHHLQGGNGRRGRGDSALASHKVHVCQSCHDAIHQHAIHLSWDDAAPFTTLRVEP